MKILLVDDHRLVADAMAMMLQDLDSEVKVTTCHTSQQALDAIDENSTFDLILTDIYMPGIDGLGLLQGLRNRSITAPVVVISGAENSKVAKAALEQGASGFINKSLPSKEMLDALRQVLRGERYQPEDLELNARQSAHGEIGDLNKTTQPSTSDIEKDDQISARQIEVLELIAKGNSNKQIAQLLNIRETTVKYHTTHLFRCLNVKNRTSCVREARRLKLISPDNEEYAE